MARTISLDGLSVKDLQEVEAEIARLLIEKRRAELADLKSKITELAEAGGFAYADLMAPSNSRPDRTKAPATVKYRNPDNPLETWSGRGRTARWLTDKLKKRGVSKDDFAV